MPGVPQGPVLGPLLFLIYINDLPDEINSLCKIFADGTSLFSKVYDIHNSARELNDDLEKISYWAYQCKMQFNPDPNKQAHEVIFSRKTKNMHQFITRLGCQAMGKSSSLIFAFWAVLF